MPTSALATLIALLVAVPVHLAWTEGGPAPVGNAARAQGSPGEEVSIDLAITVSDRGTAYEFWYEASMTAEELRASTTAGGRVNVILLLTHGEWIRVRDEVYAPGTRTRSASAPAVLADFRSEHGTEDYELVMGMGSDPADLEVDPITVGYLSTAPTQAGDDRGTGYFDFDLIAAAMSPSQSMATRGTASASTSGYLVWPEAADLGETVGILLDAKTAVDLAPDGAPLEVDPASFVVHLTDPSSFVESAQPRAAIEAPAALGSVLAENEAGSWTGIILVVDLPATWTQSTLDFGVDDLLVDVEYEGQILFSGQPLRVMGDGGSPLTAAELEPLRELQQRPMLRFRPAWDAGSSEGFDPAWQIHGVELVLHYTEPAAGDVANLVPTVNGDAAAALTFIEELTAPAGEKRWRVSIADADGFSIADKGCAGPGDCYAGRWSLLDIALDKLDEGLPVGTEIFKPSDFSIEDVTVLDAGGARLNPSFAGETFFRIRAVNNLVDPASTPPTPDPLLAWPKATYLGDTLAVLFDSEADVSLDPDAAYLDASKDNVVVKVSDPDGHEETLTPLAAVELPAALGSETVGAPPLSRTGVVAFFALPDPWPNPSPGYSLPAAFDIEVEYQSAPTSGMASVQVVGTGGATTDFSQVASLNQLSLGPLLRLRPVWNEDAMPAEGFDPAWQIGLLEFDLRYAQSGLGEVTDIGAHGNGEAVTALAMADRLPDEGAEKLWRIHLIDPDGLSLPDPEPGSIGPSPIGRWSLLDLPVEADDNGVPVGGEVFAAGEFTVEAVKVFDLDGNPLNPSYQGEPFFELEAVLPEPGTTLQWVAGLLAVSFLHRRRRGAMESSAKPPRAPSIFRRGKPPVKAGPRPWGTLLAVVLVVGYAAGAHALPAPLERGDVNRDGAVDLADALLVALHLRGGSTLGEEELYAADVAPLTSGVSAPDGQVDASDLLVLLRLVSGAIGAPAPSITSVSSPTNGFVSSITGTTLADATVQLFARDGAGNVVHLDTTTADGSGDFTFSDVPMVFDGSNEFFVAAVDVSGLLGHASSGATRSWTAPSPPCTTTCTISSTQVWPDIGSPYVIPSTGLTINDGVTLVLGPGSELQFPGGKRLTAVGQLHAIGSATSAVRFTATSTTWDGLLFNPTTTNASSLLAHVEVEDIGASKKAVQIVGGSGPSVSVTVRHSTIDASASNATGISISSTNSDLDVEWTSIVGSGLNGDGLVVTGAITPVSMTRSTISGFDHCIEDAYPNGFGSGAKHVVSYSTITGCDVGAYLQQSAVQLIPGNRIIANNVGLEVSGGSNTSCSGSTCWGYLPVVHDSLFDNATNVKADGAYFWSRDIYDQSRVILDCRQNYWGTPDPGGVADSIDEIADSIDDVTDNLVGDAETRLVKETSYGLLVDFTPFRESEGGDLDYTYISGDLNSDFPAGVDVPMRKAVGPVMVRRKKVATIPAGTTIETFVDESNGVLVDILVEGTLTVSGTSSEPVRFVAPGPNPQPGDWWGFRFFRTNADDDSVSVLEHTEIENTVTAMYAGRYETPGQVPTDPAVVHVDGAQIRYFTEAGIVFDEVDSASEVVNSVIDGLLDPGPPEMTVKDGALSNVVGIQVIESYDGCATSGTCGTIEGNKVQMPVYEGIHDLVTGIHVIGNSDPVILDNDIFDNIWGIWLQASANGDPHPSIHGNRIHDNSGDTPVISSVTGGEKQFRFCSVLGGANLCLSDYASTGITPIDATENYWGGMTGQEIFDSVLASVKVTEGDRVAVDLSEYTDDSGTIVGPASDFYSALLVDISRTAIPSNSLVNAVIRPALLSEQLEIHYSLVALASVILKIYPEDNTGGTPLRTTSLGSLSAGTDYLASWDGKDDSGRYVDDGAYVFVLEADSGSQVDRYDPDPNDRKYGPPGFQLIGDVPKHTIRDPDTLADLDERLPANQAEFPIPPGNWLLGTFNSFENDYVRFKLDFSLDPKRGEPFAAQIVGRVMERTDPNQQCGQHADDDNMNFIAKLWDQEPLWIGQHDFVWDGRADAGAEGGHTEGEIVEPGANGFCVTLEDPDALRPNHVIVTGNRPTITGEAPSVVVLSDPFVIRPVYEQVAALTFTLDQPATVNLYILPPGEESLGAAVSSMEVDGGATVPAGTKTIYWNGYGEIGVASKTNELGPTEDGPYTFALEATSVAGNASTHASNVTTIYRGVINIRGELPPGS